MSHDDHGGLHRDMPTLLSRRVALLWMGGASLAGVLAACGFGSSESTTTAPKGSTLTTSVAGSATTTSAPAATTTTALNELIGAEIPGEGPGPYPADGSDGGPNVLSDEGPFKADLTTSFGALSGTAEGIATSLHLTIVESKTGEPVPNAVVYLWHCTADGRYSIYEITDQNYLRGVQVADDAGRVSFDTVFPGCYPGRWPHCHFEVFESPATASAGSSAIKTSQLALPQADCEAVYTDARYGLSADSLANLSLSSDIVFRDGWADQLATVTGSVDQGYAASLLVRV